ncbi:MAG: hypothetical protein M3O36_18780, partial [Myxococcota bacterium]|nr:hypothetical protein [Myxococcota bacterium]
MWNRAYVYRSILQGALDEEHTPSTETQPPLRGDSFFTLPQSGLRAGYMAFTRRLVIRCNGSVLVLPFILEQRMWARRVEHVRAGRWLSFWHATPQRVARALDEVLASSARRAGAQRLAES